MPVKFSRNLIEEPHEPSDGVSLTRWKQLLGQNWFSKFTESIYNETTLIDENRVHFTYSNRTSFLETGENLDQKDEVFLRLLCSYAIFHLPKSALLETCQSLHDIYLYYANNDEERNILPPVSSVEKVAAQKVIVRPSFVLDEE